MARRTGGCPEPAGDRRDVVESRVLPGHLVRTGWLRDI
jgi:hypothetical protein